MRSPRSKNSRAKERAIQLESLFLNDLYWLGFLIALALFLLPLATQAGEYIHHELKIKKLEVDIKKYEEDIHHLARTKVQTPDVKAKEQLHKEMLESYKHLQEASESYNKERAHVRFQHPEKGDDKERQYTRHVVQPLDAFEDISLDGRLDTFMAKFHRVYGESPKLKSKKEVEKSKRDTASEKKPFDPDSMDQSITLSK